MVKLKVEKSKYKTTGILNVIGNSKIKFKRVIKDNELSLGKEKIKSKELVGGRIMIDFIDFINIIISIGFIMITLWFMFSVIGLLKKMDSRLENLENNINGKKN